jgi:chitodextrinase
MEVTFTPPVNGITQPINVPRGTEIYIVEGLNNGVEYTFTVQAVDVNGNKNSGQSEKGTPDSSAPSDITPPAKVTGLSGSSGSAQVTLTWTDPADGDLDHIEITFSPEAAGVTQPVSVPKGTGTRVITGLTNGTAYTFTVTAVDASGNRSGGEPTGPYTPSETPDNTPPAGIVKVEFTGPWDETITLTGADTALSKAENTSLTVSVSGTFDAYKWYLDGVPIPEETGNTLNGSAGNLSVKTHRLTVVVTTGGVEYAKRVTFTVTP